MAVEPTPPLPQAPTPQPPIKDSDDMDRQAVLDDAGLLDDDL